MGGLEANAEHEKILPSRMTRWCTRKLKIEPIAEYLDAILDAGSDVINAVGVRADESEARSKYPELEWSKGLDCQTWRPLLRWTTQDVIDIHAKHGLPPNPLYLRGRGVSRVGCYPCIFARKDEIRQVAETAPDRIVRIRILEEKISRIAGKPATFFHPRISGEEWPIDRVVEWSKTARGGRQYELFADDQDMGCARWGLCETNTPKKDGE